MPLIPKFGLMRADGFGQLMRYLEFRDAIEKELRWNRSRKRSVWRAGAMAAAGSSGRSTADLRCARCGLA